MRWTALLPAPGEAEANRPWVSSGCVASSWTPSALAKWCWSYAASQPVQEHDSDRDHLACEEAASPHACHTPKPAERRSMPMLISISWAVS